LKLSGIFIAKTKATCHITRQASINTLVSVRYQSKQSSKQPYHRGMKASKSYLKIEDRTS